MRTLVRIPISFVVVALVVLSCQKNQKRINGLTQEEYNNAKKNLDIINKTSEIHEEVVIFNTLTISEKAAVWNLHLTNCIKSMKLNETQKDIINEALDILKPSLYNQGSSLNNLKRIDEKIKINFDSEELRTIFITLPNQVTITKIITPPSGPSCECSVKSDYCGTFESNSSQTKCQTQKCSTSSGCGTFFAYTCNGRCMITLN